MSYPTHHVDERSASINRTETQSGFTLIELLIAITIALFLVGALAAIMIGLKSSFSTQDSLTQIQETERFALTVLNNTIRSAGYFPNPAVLNPDTEFPASVTSNPDSSAFVKGESIVGTTIAASDTLNIRMESASGDGLMNCQGDTNTSGANIVWVNSFSVNSSNQLVCAVSANNAAFGTATILTDNVRSMKIMYGVDTNPSAGDGSADIYQDAASITKWSLVKSVRISLTLVDLVNSKPGVPVNLPNKLVHTINLMSRS